jgi:dTMP kinase
VSVPLRAPHGPLAWLFPELLRDPAAATADAQALADFQTTAARLRDPDARLAVEPGPRGHAVAAVLRDRAPQPWRQVPRVAITPAPHSFEGAVLDGAHRHPGTALEIEHEAGVHRAHVAPLQRAAARARTGTTSAWVLPVPADRAGAASLADAHALVAQDPSTFATAGLVPVLLPNANPSDAPRARVAPAWFGLSGGDDPEPAALAAHRALVALLYPERALELDGWDNLAVSGCDLYTLGLRAALGIDQPAAAPRPRAKIFAVCGIDGSGKSTHARALAEALAARGLRAATLKIYRHGVFHETVTDLTRRTDGARNLHLWRMERLAKVFDSVKCYTSRVAATLADHDAVVFDRYVQTHFAAGTGRCHWDPFARELLAVYPPADHVFFLDVPVPTALARIGERDARTVDENSYMLGRYRAMLLAMCGEGMTRLDGEAPFAENHQHMCHTVDQVLQRAHPR